MKRAASECSDNDVFFDDGDMLKDGSVTHFYIRIRVRSGGLSRLADQVAVLGGG